MNPSNEQADRLLVADEPVEFEKYLVQIQDLGKITDPFRGYYRNFSI